MDEHKRLTPDQWLERLKHEQAPTQGKLKLFLGAAPGVGKTYAMLQEARDRIQHGVKVVVGVVETHQRSETEKMLAGLEILPRKTTEYRGIILDEFDLDAAIARAPQLILIDEMAHTNAAGCRHPKRWQDVKELLNCGIDVYSTLNVQHLESLNDIVFQITGVKVRETVPDVILELADAIELIDLPPDDLLSRLSEGKVYLGRQAELAKTHFFRKGNLTALRELALRVTAEQVNRQVQSARQDSAASNPWATVDRLLVCIGPNDDSQKLIRAAKRMASHLKAPWIAVFIDSPTIRLSEEQHSCVIKSLRLAEHLGGESMTISGIDFVETILNFARLRNVTKIVIEKKMRSRWHQLFHRSLVDELLRHSSDIDVYVISTAQDHPPEKIRFRRLPGKKLGYFFATASVFVCTGINLVLARYLDNVNAIMIYLLGLIVIATRGWFGAALWGSFLSVLAFDYFFVTPAISLNMEDTQYLITFLIMGIIVQVISHLAVLSHRQAADAEHREQRVMAMYTLTRQLALVRGRDNLLRVAVCYLADLFKSEVLVLLPETDNKSSRLQIRAKSRSDYHLNSKELSIAQWAQDMGQRAGLGTDTLAVSKAIYLPLLGIHGTVGVLHLLPSSESELLDPEQFHLLEALVNQIALALEVEKIDAQSHV